MLLKKGSKEAAKKTEIMYENKEREIIEKFSNIIQFFQQELIKKVSLELIYW